MVAHATASTEEYAWVAVELAHGVPFHEDSAEPQKAIPDPQLFTGSI